jgi:hypothetical protein
MRVGCVEKSMNRNSLAAAVATIVVALVVVLGFRALGGPRKQRLVRADQRTVQALAQLAQQIDFKWASGGKVLPANLEKFPENARKNPVNGTEFVYHVKSANEYELCSTFLADNRDAPDVNTADPWLHPQGEHCFTFDPAQSVNVPWVPNY